MTKKVMQQLSLQDDGDRTFREIRRVLHPDTVITRCESCGKPIRPHIDEPFICGKCSE
jgi:hypothetical protein